LTLRATGTSERLSQVADSDFRVNSNTDAVRNCIRCAVASSSLATGGATLQTEHERFLTEELFRKPASSPEPERNQSVLHAPHDDGKTVAAMDSSFPGSEIIGGSQREYGSISRADPSRYASGRLWWYLDLRRYGEPPCGIRARL
jgi:asparaginyl-tRNA synthetase